MLEVNCSGERSGQSLLKLAGEATQSNRLNIRGTKVAAGEWNLRPSPYTLEDTGGWCSHH